MNEMNKTYNGRIKQGIWSYSIVEDKNLRFTLVRTKVKKENLIK